MGWVEGAEAMRSPGSRNRRRSLNLADVKRALPLLLAAALALPTIAATPRLRPANWAEPLVETSLDNAYRVSADLYRCEQPQTEDIADLKALGVKSILNLRNFHSDSEEFAKAGFTLLAKPMNAGEVTEDLLVAALRDFRDAPKPVVVHCWHGSDRTGVFVAAYRIVFQGWTPEAASDEFRNGGYGFHKKWYPNLVELLSKLDAEALRKRVLDKAGADSSASPATPAPAATKAQN